MRSFHGILIFVASLMLAACGGGDNVPYCGPSDPSCSSGGSGGGTGGTTGAPTLTLTLQDSTGTPLESPLLTGTQNAFAVATVLDSKAQPIANTLVAFSGTGLALTPASGQTLTDASGVARVEMRSLDPFAQGATMLTAVSAVSGTSVQGSLAIGLGAATASLSALTVSSESVPAYQTIQVAVTASVSGSTTPAVQYPVNFSATCGVFDPPTANTDSTGVARTAYRNQAGASSACSGTQTLTARAGTDAVTKTITALQPTPTNILFASATPSRIYLNGAPGAPGNQSLVQFKLVDNNGNPIQGENILLSLTLRPANAYLGSVAGTTSLIQPTSADGTVVVSLHAGDEPGPVQLSATLVSNSNIQNVSNNLSIASGLPVQNAFSLSVSTFNMEAWTTDGVKTQITLRIADRLGNPVPDGTTVNFVTEGGQIVASCNTTGAEANNTAECAVALSSQNPRPKDGRLTVVAWAQGEESFTDKGTPSNNVWDKGESFDDLGQPFLDRNENGVYDSGIDSTVGTSSGSGACPPKSALPAGYLSVNNTCDGTWGSALVRQSTVIVFSDSLAYLSGYSMTANGPKSCTAKFTLKDVNGNLLPSRSTLAISAVAGGGPGGSGGNDAKFEGFGLDGDSTPNTTRPADVGSTHTVLFSNCNTPAAVTFKLTVTTPAGKVTNFLLP